jgi:hypothetical protein
MNMIVTACPVDERKDSSGEYARYDLLYFLRREDAQRWIDTQPYKDGHIVFDVPILVKGRYCLHKQTLHWWGQNLVHEAEEFADMNEADLIEFKTSWLE